MSVHKILLDSNSYFRLADNLKPLLANEFGKSRRYKFYILSGTDSEFKRQPRLRHKFDWLANEEHEENRKRGVLKILERDKSEIAHVKRFLMDATIDMELGCSGFDVYCAAVAKVLTIPLVTDDSDLLSLSREYDIDVMSTMEVMRLMYDEDRISFSDVEGTIALWQYFDDYPANFHREYKKLFGE